MGSEPAVPAGGDGVRMHETRRRSASRRFTLSELLLVMTIALLITLLAYPALQTFQGANKDASAATRLVRVYNRVVDQARRENRAFVFELSLFLAAEPGGRMDIFEARTTSCATAAQRRDDENEVRRIESQPFGGTVINTYVGPVEPNVGLRSWVIAEDDEQREPLRLCIAPDGTTYRIRGRGVDRFFEPIEVRVQRFQIDRGGWARVGPPRQVVFTWGSGARLRLN